MLAGCRRGRARTRRFKASLEVAVKEEFVQVSQQKVVILFLSGAFKFLEKHIYLRLDFSLTDRHMFTLQSTVLVARRGGYVANI